MSNARMAAPDARPTENELLAIARKGYGEKLAQFCDDQRAYPHHAADYAVANQTGGRNTAVMGSGVMPVIPIIGTPDA